MTAQFTEPEKEFTHLEWRNTRKKLEVLDWNWRCWCELTLDTIDERRLDGERDRNNQWMLVIHSYKHTKHQDLGF